MCQLSDRSWVRSGESWCVPGTVNILERLCACRQLAACHFTNPNHSLHSRSAYCKLGGHQVCLRAPKLIPLSCTEFRPGLHPGDRCMRKDTSVPTMLFHVPPHPSLLFIPRTRWFVVPALSPLQICSRKRQPDGKHQGRAASLQTRRYEAAVAAAVHLLCDHPP